MNTETYIMTSTAFEGEVFFEFNELQLLTKYDLSGAILTETQQVYLLKNMPRDLSELQAFIKSTKTAEIKPFEITFKTFWDKYDEKLCSSKKKAEAKWNKMPKAEQMKAFKGIAKYVQHLPSGTRKKYTETYLNAELWNN